MTQLQIALPAAQRGRGRHPSSFDWHDGGDVPPGRCCLVEDDDGRHRRHGGHNRRGRISHAAIRVTSEFATAAALQAGSPTHSGTASSPATSPQAGLQGRIERFLMRRLAPTSRGHRSWPRPYIRSAALGGLDG
jgi:hypothetical protein